MTRVREVDVAVVGAGFAGLVCARTLAMRGLEVVVLERKFEPGERLHTTGILVREAADALDIPVRYTRRIHRVRLYSPSLRSMDLDGRGYYFLATDTGGLLRWLAREADRAGANVSCGKTFSGATERNGFLELDGLGVRARYVIGADGARSRVARHFGLGHNQRFLVGVEAEFDDDELVESDRLHCFVDSNIAPGYIAWMVPGVGVTQVGVACRWPCKPDLQRFIRQTAHLAPLQGRKPVGWRAGTIPVGGLVTPFATGRVLLVGDAAGLVSPLTGGGIANAFHFGRRAAQAVSDHLLDDAPEPSRILAREYPSYRFKGWLRRALELEPPNGLIEAALSHPLIKRIAQPLFFHRRRCVSEREGERYFKALVEG